MRGMWSSVKKTVEHEQKTARKVERENAANRLKWRDQMDQVISEFVRSAKQLGQPHTTAAIASKLRAMEIREIPIEGDDRLLLWLHGRDPEDRVYAGLAIFADGTYNVNEPSLADISAHAGQIRDRLTYVLYLLTSSPNS